MNTSARQARAAYRKALLVRLGIHKRLSLPGKPIS
jgi:hypothetical protein